MGAPVAARVSPVPLAEAVAAETLPVPPVTVVVVPLTLPVEAVLPWVWVTVGVLTWLLAWEAVLPNHLARAGAEFSRIRAKPLFLGSPNPDGV